LVLAAVVCAACASCAVAQPRSGKSIIEYSHRASLGAGGSADHLAREFLVAGEEDREGFGYYVYLLAQPEASRQQLLHSFTAFLAWEKVVNFQSVKPIVAERQLALMVVPVKQAGEPSSAEQLLENYDGVRAAIIARALQRSGGRELPSVALVAYPRPIRGNARLSAEELIVGDACGNEQEVRIKFARLQEALRGQHYEDPVFKFGQLLGQLLTGFSSRSCI
jgi:hypothetical protein